MDGKNTFQLFNTDRDKQKVLAVSMQIRSTIGADGLPSIILQYFLSLYSLNICILLATSALFWPIKTRFKDLTSEIQQFL